MLLQQSWGLPPLNSALHFRAHVAQFLRHNAATQPSADALTHSHPGMLHTQVKAGHVQTTPLAASGGASGVGASIASYVEACDADMVVLGSRGLHGWHRWGHTRCTEINTGSKSVPARSWIYC